MLLVAQITAPHFCAGIALRDGLVVEAAPILGYMAKQKWSRDRVRTYCQEKGWTIVAWMEKSDGDDTAR